MKINCRCASNSRQSTIWRIKVRSIGILLLIGISAQIASGISLSEPRDGKDHLWWAERLLADITHSNTSYMHTKDFSGVTWKHFGSPISQSRTDCSGFVDELLMHTYGFTPNYMKHWLGGDARPKASGYYAAIIDQRGFTHIKKVSDIKAGDIIAISYPYGKSDSGHVMIVASPPEKISQIKPLIDQADQWMVLIIDSSKSPHWKPDTRWDGATSYDGLGKGPLRIYSKDDGDIAGYTWSLSPKSKFNSRQDHPIAAGRLDPKFRIYQMGS
jgi:hypothetical protein